MNGADREFAKLWTATTASGVGDGLVLVAAPLLASSLTSDPRLIAGVTTALTLPYALFGLPAGVLIDRLDRRRGMAAVDAVRALLLGAFTLLVASGLAHGGSGLVALYACFFLVGTFETFFRDAAQALVPHVVPENRLVTANSRVMAAEIVTKQFAGPVLGGLMYAAAVSLPFAVDAVSFAVSSVLLFRLRPAYAPAAPATAAPRRSLLADMRDGLRWLLRHRLLRLLALLAGLSNLVNWAILAVLVVFARQHLHLSRTGYSLLLVASAAGGLTASRIGPAVVRRTGRGWALCLGLAAQAVPVAGYLVVTSPVLVGVLIAVNSAGVILWNVVTIVLRQTLVPDHLRGRVASIYRLVAWGCVPLGSLVGGALTHAYGLRAVFALGAVVLGLSALRLVPVARTVPAPTPSLVPEGARP